MTSDERGVQIPNGFNSPDHEAKFWDNNDLSELTDSLENAQDLDRPSRALSTTFAIRIDPTTLEQIRDLATLYNLGPTKLVREWVLERLRLERRVGGLAPRSTLLDPQAEIDFRRHAIENVIGVLPEVADRVLATALQEYDGARYGTFTLGVDE